MIFSPSQHVAILELSLKPTIIFHNALFYLGLVVKGGIVSERAAYLITTNILQPYKMMNTKTFNLFR